MTKVSQLDEWKWEKVPSRDAVIREGENAMGSADFVRTARSGKRPKTGEEKLILTLFYYVHVFVEVGAIKTYEDTNAPSVRS